MRVFDLIEELRGDTDINEFMDSVDLDRSTYYKWRDEGKEPGRRSLSKIEHGLGITFVYEDGVAQAWKRTPVSDTLSGRHVSNALTQGQTDWITFMTQNPGEEIMITMYQEDSREWGLPDWESLTNGDRDIVLKSYLAFIHDIRREYSVRHKRLVSQIADDLGMSGLEPELEGRMPQSPDQT